MEIKEPLGGAGRFGGRQRKPKPPGEGSKLLVGPFGGEKKEKEGDGDDRKAEVVGNQDGEIAEEQAAGDCSPDLGPPNQSPADKEEVGGQADKAGVGQEVEVFVVGFVVEKFPLGEQVVESGPDGEVGVAKGFQAGAKERVL